MLSSTKTLGPDAKFARGLQSLSERWKDTVLKKSVLVMLLFSILIFATALYYVEQQVRLQTLNYDIIELKNHRKLLVEQQRSYQLQLDRLKNLERVERQAKMRGFVPIEKEQLRIVR
ncbi:hypothetical protein CSB45_08260 [candidate division KSB3 bacterium]|uniref:Cell division protein FtsL n=1 Tax=candidate division KSB3 bacterium TaxID=2044937 RepID=A0A2G6E5S8_9BACT|nr:MAG: hypothetical protein CSB45_08260 [candidate division KSB3 bacterium]PIE29787.1 MAG: hypothetical protein CSA57_06955 [candidate division KSB3 bacterium]